MDAKHVEGRIPDAGGESRPAGSEQAPHAEVHPAARVREPLDETAAVRHVDTARSSGQPVGARADKQPAVRDEPAVQAGQGARTAGDARQLQVGRDDEAATDLLHDKAGRRLRLRRQFLHPWLLSRSHTARRNDRNQREASAAHATAPPFSAGSR